MIIKHFSYPWLYKLITSLMIMTLGYFYFIHPEIQSLIDLQHKETEFRQTLSLLSLQDQHKLIGQVAPHILDESAFSAPASLAVLVQASGLVIKSQYVVSPASSDKINLKLDVQGTDKQLWQFLSVP